MSRWIRVQTSVFEHELFAKAEYSQREAWLWLIANVAWKETRHRIGSDILPVPVGSMFVTLRSLQAAWHWKSDKRVRSFLSMLESEKMITTKTDAGKTQIIVCNYSFFQDSGRSEDASGTQAGRSEDALKTPIHQYTNTSSLRSDDAKPGKATARDELESVLDADHADAVIQHRQKIRKPLTAHAAKLLAGKFARYVRPNDAADAMIANGWQGFEVEWMENRAGHRQQAPPRRERTILDAIDDFIRDNDHEPAEFRTIDHDGGDYPPNVRRLAHGSGNGRQ